MRVLLQCVAVMLCIGTLKAQQVADVQPPSDTTLRNELLRMGEQDQTGREDLMAAVARKDTATLFRFMRADSSYPAATADRRQIRLADLRARRS
ncbi:MAG TPA: hypothetical protein VJ825_07010 [Gemmatimonadaceae bacterium]|nr:hypothetical protein [Gemmatimonadaceae bacterium]